MAALNTTSTGPAAIIRQHFDAKFMDRLERDAIVADLLESRTIPTNSGDVVQFHRMQALALQTVGLSANDAAGQAWGNAHPSIHATAGQLKATAFVIDNVPAQLQIIGNDTQITELALLTMEPNPIPELSDVFMYNGLGTMEQKCYNLMISGQHASNPNGDSQTSTVPSVTYNGASVSVTTIWGDGSATLTEATLDADNPNHRAAAESLNVATFRLRNNAVPVHPRFGLYAALVSPGTGADLRLDGTFQEIALKGTNRGENKFERALIGDIFGCRVMETPYASYALGSSGTIDATNDQIHRSVVFGLGYACKISHKTGPGRPKFNLIMPSPSAADPYGNVAFLTWKAYFAGTVLNPLAGVIWKTATTNTARNQSGDQGQWG